MEGPKLPETNLHGQRPKFQSSTSLLDRVLRKVMFNSSIGCCVIYILTGYIASSSLPSNAPPHSGIVGAYDTLAAGVANPGNSLGAGAGAALSGAAGAVSALGHGLTGTGKVSTGFLSYNNRPSSPKPTKHARK